MEQCADGETIEWPGLGQMHRISKRGGGGGVADSKRRSAALARAFLVLGWMQDPNSAHAGCIGLAPRFHSVVEMLIVRLLCT